MHFQWFHKAKEKLLGGLKSNNPQSPSTTYNIFKPCTRCVYGRKVEPILIYSLHRGVRVIVNYNGKTFVRRGKCLGFKECGKCTDAIDKKIDVPCKWIKI